ncbi:MAG: hypothetical protein KDA28_02665, partial [Phycisphaerales bacterium]|nr:hypothetical protein [Phycisphaerales bacterium]
MSSDVDRLDRLFLGGHPCIRMQSYEEDEALEVIRAASMGAQRDLHVWTLLDGVTEGMLADARPVPDTVNPAAALFHMSRVREPSIFCTLDLAPHLDDPHVMRALRR